MVDLLSSLATIPLPIPSESAITETPLAVSKKLALSPEIPPSSLGQAAVATVNRYLFSSINRKAHLPPFPA